YSGAGGTQACCSGPLVNGQCPSPITPPISTCPSGYVSIGSACCLASQRTSTGTCCPAGQVPSGPNKAQCQPPILIPIKWPPLQCCPTGQIPAVSQPCCAAANVTSNGACCPEPVDSADRSHCRVLIPLAACAPGYSKMSDGTCCINRNVSRDGTYCITNQKPCANGQFRDLSGACLPIPPAAGCAPGEVLSPGGECVAVPPITGCPPGELLS